MKGPLNSVAPHGAWSPGLQKTRLYDLLLQDIILGDLPPMQVLEEKAQEEKVAYSTKAEEKVAQQHRCARALARGHRIVLPCLLQMS